MRNKKSKIFTNIQDIIEHDLILAFQGWHRLNPDSSLDEKMQRAYDTVLYYIKQDLAFVSSKTKKKINDIFLDIPE